MRAHSGPVSSPTARDTALPALLHRPLHILPAAALSLRSAQRPLPSRQLGEGDLDLTASERRADHHPQSIDVWQNAAKVERCILADAARVLFAGALVTLRASPGAASCARGSRCSSRRTYNRLPTRCRKTLFWCAPYQALLFDGRGLRQSSRERATFRPLPASHFVGPTTALPVRQPGALVRLERVPDHSGNSVCDARLVARGAPPALRGAAVGEPRRAPHGHSNLADPGDRVPVGRFLLQLSTAGWLVGAPRDVPQADADGMGAA
eukprot:699876-Prymnesium_polylepis.2